jgi:hypothetical protein
MEQKDILTWSEFIALLFVCLALVGIVFYALNPLQRIRDARDEKRFTDINTILTAIKVDQLDNNGIVLPEISKTRAGDVYMITSGKAGGCNTQEVVCGVPVSSVDHCIDLTKLVEKGYLRTLPIAPQADLEWDAGLASTDEGTGYTFERSEDGAFTIRACEAESVEELSVSR